MTTRALVLSGGGIVGIAWETGFVAGLAEGGVDLAEADLIVGTSAGSVVGTRLALGDKAADLLDEAISPRIDPAEEAVASPANIDMSALVELGQKIVGAEKMTAEVLRDIGALALKTETVDEARWLAPFEDQIAGRTWPETKLLLTAVDVESGEFRAWDRDSGVELARAVASSCAVPALFPPVTIDGSRYMDGGIRSVNNADLAKGYDKVLVVAFLNMFAQAGGPLGKIVNVEYDLLRESGSEVEVVGPDEQAVAAFGMNPMDMNKRVEGGQEGLRQGRELADKLRAFWSAPVAATGS
jgi:NTE family protein